MVPEFAWLPPEINSARIFAGAGAGPLFAAASAWEGLAAELAGAASSFDAVIAGLTGGPWAGPASVSMAAAAAPYVGWLSAAAVQAETAAASAVTAATAFESAVAATVHPAAVAANRVLLGALVATNFLGQNTPAIAATEFDYVEMWAQDVGAMVGYDAGAGAAAAELMPFGVPPLDLAGLASQLGAQVTGLATTATAAVSPALQGALAGVPGVVSGVQSLASSLPLSSVMQVAQVAGYPASMLISPLMQLANTANAGTAGLAGATAAGLADAPKFVGDVNPMKGLGGGAGVGAGIGAELGKARLVGAMSVPPTWEGSMPKGLSSAAMAGLGGLPNAAELAQAAGTGGGMGMMPMPMGMGGAGAGMPGGMMGRGGANPHVVQARPSVIPRTGVG
ncbi:PPE family protein [Mycobacterium kansasii 662]|uniref:PPE family protein n=3 Tax=Mycobacterium kansasii TaxID=1768 RepID=X7ZH62_MYCKA|nr:PPE family protein [Mycobacterium kansasii]EUA18709.1 PPE family protein [Mycobacterium kansasii 662]UCA20274.1 PPE family protein [Mycobacterium kansasii]UGT80332.1 PPE family protein [Mycobacterium kansasii]UGT84610.1 PPE family protein [Mycobacterium kansasii]